ncbi:MAG: chromate transporter [Oscillospiraceae bacterium]|nr:chromate transporter [Oscillospiraceae bacterium]
MNIFLDLFLTFFKIGLFTFGGGYAMLPLILEEVELHGWLPQQALIDFIAVSESTPGPFAINIATYVGSELGGLFGSFCATLGVVLPSFIVILIVARCYEKFKESRYVKGALNGLRPAAIGLIGSAVLTTALEIFFPAGFSNILGIVLSIEFISSLLIFALALFLILKKKKHPIIIILISAALGIAAGYLPMLF